MKSKYKMAYRLARETEVKENDLGKGVFKRAFIPNRANPETGEALPVTFRTLRSAQRPNNSACSNSAFNGGNCPETNHHPEGAGFCKSESKE